MPLEILKLIISQKELSWIETVSILRSDPDTQYSLLSSEMFVVFLVRRSLRVEVEVEVETRECPQQPPFPARLSQLSVLRCGVVWWSYPGTTRSVSVSPSHTARVEYLVLDLVLLLLLLVVLVVVKRERLE